MLGVALQTWGLQLRCAAIGFLQKTQSNAFSKQATKAPATIFYAPVSTAVTRPLIGHADQHQGVEAPHIVTRRATTRSRRFGKGFRRDPRAQPAIDAA